MWSEYIVQVTYSIHRVKRLRHFVSLQKRVTGLILRWYIPNVIYYNADWNTVLHNMFCNDKFLHWTVLIPKRSDDGLLTNPETSYLENLHTCCVRQRFNKQCRNYSHFSSSFFFFLIRIAMRFNWAYKRECHNRRKSGNLRVFGVLCAQVLTNNIYPVFRHPSSLYYSKANIDGILPKLWE